MDRFFTVQKNWVRRMRADNESVDIRHIDNRPILLFSQVYKRQEVRLTNQKELDNEKFNFDSCIFRHGDSFDQHRRQSAKNCTVRTWYQQFRALSLVPSGANSHSFQMSDNLDVHKLHDLASNNEHTKVSLKLQSLS